MNSYNIKVLRRGGRIVTELATLCNFHKAHHWIHDAHWWQKEGPEERCIDFVPIRGGMSVYDAEIELWESGLRCEFAGIVDLLHFYIKYPLFAQGLPIVALGSTLLRDGMNVGRTYVACIQFEMNKPCLDLLETVDDELADGFRIAILNQ